MPNFYDNEIKNLTNIIELKIQHMEDRITDEAYDKQMKELMNG